MKTRELILVSIIIGYLLAVFSFLVIEQEIKFQNYERKPMQMVELFGNGSSRNYEIENISPDPNLFYSIGIVMIKLAFALPFVIAGIGIIGVPMALIHSNLVMSPEGIRSLVFWIMAFVSIPITVMFSKDISLYRRVPYIYVFVVLISGTPVLLSDSFGQ